MSRDDLPELLTVEEVANACRVSRQTVLNWIDAGSLKARRLGPEGSRTLRISVDEYRRFIGAA